ncbi:MAG: DUF4349 domain-containing protein [Halobacteriota archaeon]
MSQSKRRLILSAVVAVLVVFAGCTGAGGDGADGESLAADAGSQPQVTGTDGSDGDATTRGSRAIIRTGHVWLEVEDFDRSQANVTATVEGYGGYVSDTREERNQVNEGTYVDGQLVLRVPKDNFSALLSDIKAEGTVHSVSTNTEDVTDQLVDIEARLTNLYSQREKLRELYDEADDTEDVLAVQERLSEVQTEIERLEARQQSLEQRVAYSTITVDLSEERPPAELTRAPQWYDTPLVEAFLDSVQGVLTTLRAMVVAVAYLLPYVFVFVTPVALIALLVRRQRRGTSFGE